MVLLHSPPNFETIKHQENNKLWILKNPSEHVPFLTNVTDLLVYKNLTNVCKDPTT